MYKKIFPAILLIGLLTACSTTATDTPASLPTDQPAAPTQTSAPANTAVPVNPTESVPPTEAPVQVATVSFANDVLPILQNRCGNCHGGNQTEEGLVLLSYADVMNGSNNGPVITPGNASNSLLVEVVVNQDMPKRGPKLTPDQVQIITDWVNQGALDN